MSDATNELDKRIAAAMAALHGARVTANRNPTVENIRAEDKAEHTLNELLECRSAMSKADRVVSA